MAIDSISSASSSIPYLQSSIASGTKIDSGSGNAVAQAITTSLTSQINMQDVAVGNANMGVSLLQTADGVSEGVGNLLQRMSELSIQAQNGTYSDSQRSILNQEFQQSLESINQFVGQANFNGTNLLDGSTPEIDIALGGSSSTLNLPNFSTAGLSLDGLDISSSTGAESALASLTEAFDLFSTGRSTLGAQQNGLTSSISNLETQSLNSQSTRSQISDTDFAKALTELATQQIKDDIGIAMQSQRNQDKSKVLQLLS